MKVMYKDKVGMFLTLLTCVLLWFMLGGCEDDPRRTFHKPGTYDCCVVMWYDTNQD